MRALLILALAGNALAEVPDEPMPSPSPSPEAVAPAPVSTPSWVAPIVAAPPAVVIEEARTATWPYTLDLHVLVGAELHTQGQPVAFGIGGEGLYHGWIGIFASLLASEGAPIIVGNSMPSLADRISVPLGFAVRPVGRAAQKHSSWAWRLLGGIGLQAGLTIEHLRSSDADATTAGLHLAASLDVPVYGGPIQGGVALRVVTRLIVTPEVTLEANQAIQEPIASGQIFLGLAYIP